MLAAVAAAAGLSALSAWTLACPFCSAVSLTFSEEIGNSQVAVVAKLTQAPPPATDPAASAVEVVQAKFEIIKVLKGEEALGKTRQIDVVYFGDSPVGTTFLIMGIDPPAINWSTPIAISERGIDYVTKAMALPADGPDRLAFFQEFLEDKDEMLGRDAYDEFAKAPYSAVLALKDRMHHDQLVEWIKSSEVPVSRRRLYLTMLGACGKPEDLPVLEEMIKSKDRQTKGALDALVAAYLTLKGPDGMPLVEELFLANKDAEYTDTYAAIMALRFHGTEEKIIPRERLLAGLRLMLDRPQLADLVIPDLARWEDWSVVDKLVELFKTSNEESSWVRVPVINYLRACPKPEAKTKLDELAALDPESMKRANSFFPFAAAATSGDKPGEPPQPVAGEAVPKPAATDTAKTAPAEPAKSAPAEPAKTAESAAPAGASPAPLADQPKPAEKAATVAAPAGGGPSEPAPPASSLPVLGGLAVAAVLLAFAFWAILKGGHQTAG
jgi:hypothetical protein